MMMSNGSMSILSTSYTATDEDMYAAEDYMKSLESELQEQINNIPNVYVGYDEYNYDIDEIGHDAYGLISYLTAKICVFVFDDATKQIFRTCSMLYTLSVQTIHEVRSYSYTTTDADGNKILVTVYYDYYICNTTLTANDFDETVRSKLEISAFMICMSCCRQKGQSSRFILGGIFGIRHEQIEALLERKETTEKVRSYLDKIAEMRTKVKQNEEETAELEISVFLPLLQ